MAVVLSFLRSSSENVIVDKHFPAGIYLLKVNNRNTRTRCEIYSKLTIKTPERHLLKDVIQSSSFTRLLKIPKKTTVMSSCFSKVACVVFLIHFESA